MSRGPDAGTLLRRAIEAAARAAGCTVTVTDSRMTRWASATFTGARHDLTLVAADDAAFAAWIESLPEAELPLRGHLVADLVVRSVTRVDQRVELVLEALSVAL
ncbi:hypothetical protein U1872_07180 [Sphingomonas sp. RB3P16]|uniref:hypothetical protein n=1 Tax=Parasphingomonas frigoris TaxID=3096163 RepID=UPI002FC62EBC